MISRPRARPVSAAPPPSPPSPIRATVNVSPDGSVLFWYSSDNLSPKVTTTFLERQRRLLLPGQYAREHQNQWIDAADAFTSASEVDAAMGQAWTMQLAGSPGVDYELFVDLGAIHDPTVLAVGHALAGSIYIDKLLTLQGTREAPVRIAVVEQTIRQLADSFHIVRGRIESWQGLALVQSLAGFGVELFTPTQKSNAEEWPVLAHHLSAGTLILPPHPRLREELLNLSYEQGPSGIKVSDKGSIHQDHAVAVRGVVASLSQRMQLGAEPDNEMTAEEYAQIRAALPQLSLAPWGAFADPDNLVLPDFS